MGGQLVVVEVNVIGVPYLPDKSHFGQHIELCDIIVEQGLGAEPLRVGAHHIVTHNFDVVWVGVVIIEGDLRDKTLEVLTEFVGDFRFEVFGEVHPIKFELKISESLRPLLDYFHLIFGS